MNQLRAGAEAPPGLRREQESLLSSRKEPYERNLRLDLLLLGSGCPGRAV